MDSWESSQIKEIENKLDTDIKTGLTEEEATKRLIENGKNELPTAKVTPWWVTFLHAFVEPLQLILMFAAVISVVAPLISSPGEKIGFHEFIDFVVIMLIVIVDAVLETVQTVKARKSVDALKSLSKPKAVVLRDHNQKEIDASDLVVGDIVILEAGKYVPAELRIVQSADFMIDEAILTGESVPVEKTHKAIKDTTILAEKTNIAFMSTFTTAGRAVGIVIGTGLNTEIGKISEAIDKNEETETPLEKKISKFGYVISCVAGLIGIFVFLLLSLVGGFEAWASYLMVAITLAIGVIPESLAAVISITLSFSTKRMANNNVIVKKLASVETLGSVNVICTDKTGTLTQNKMTVKKVIDNNRIMDSDEYLDLDKSIQKELLLKALVLPNDSITEGNERIGDPTELALVDFAELMGVDELVYRKKFERIDEIPFDSERKLMSTLNTVDKKTIAFTKGAIDQLLSICDHIMIENKVIKLTESHKHEIMRASINLSDDALRVLAFAYKEVKNNKLEEKGLTFIGAVAMIDPVRKEAVQAIEEAHAAGVEVCMITGDHAITALAIARDLGLAYDEKQVISSDKLDTMSDAELEEVIDNIRVFARVNPEHKVKIVATLQKKGYIVSMTGDGVNDAPSLSKADIGVAMGITGTDVAKQASDVILTDDNFATIMTGVNEGRNVYQKIKRAITLLMGFNLANVLSILIISLIFKISPLEATNILYINLIVESCLAIAIGMGPLDDTLMKLKPQVGKNGLLKGLILPIIKIGVLSALCSVGSFFIGMMATNTGEWNTILLDKNIINVATDSWLDQIHAIMNSSLSAIERNKLLDEYIVFGRTAMFITIVMSPLFFAHLIKISNWKASKKIKLQISKPLIYASLIALVLSIGVITIPGLNDSILGLVGYSKATSKWTSDNIWIMFVAFAISIVPFLLILMIDTIVFYSYHLSVGNWQKNQILIAEMINQDAKEQNKKRKK
ncbi:Lead, cadmium, zinc and mercury transporting ATPase; Copper-translocating P-type ATPase [Mesoplasma florum W37]|uniref:Lead, cadmium, zinc and mercury transporting ATPase n=1 Tax=Mesoplasma florum TaxID=2151 RepID=A0AAD0MN88_MESFO|nr:cation-translocating P-type ATPase [Mesoplasma florum]AGY41443.1 Lead, cadmium, zinc and mercury transporting ATPase; Copper-translocating P-type ATPase [Mesoplasma florum W37]AVN59662.1 cation-translocating P-type ATPase [Mesoplasma florum]AVN65783.1 Lead, cadmium, zinc and mercury transporting ATPase [Mesoplasma florum]